MLTGHDTDADTILGSTAGRTTISPNRCSRCCWRGCAPSFARMNNLRTRSSSLAPYTFKPAMKMLIDQKDRKIRLTEKETNILKFLYRAQDGVVPRDVLLHEVWGYNAGVTTHTLETHLSPAPEDRARSSNAAAGDRIRRLSSGRRLTPRRPATRAIAGHCRAGTSRPLHPWGIF